MKYVVTGVWKHIAAFDWEKMRQNMAHFKDNAPIAEAHWYEIEETTHGGVVTYHSKKAYETNLAPQKEYRAKLAKERSVQMLQEAHGECHSELNSLLPTSFLNGNRGHHLGGHFFRCALGF